MLLNIRIYFIFGIKLCFTFSLKKEEKKIYV